MKSGDKNINIYVIISLQVQVHVKDYNNLKDSVLRVKLQLLD